jgi:hypothetical protein
MHTCGELRNIGFATSRYRERRVRPLCWWEVAALIDPASLPFLALIRDALGEATFAGRLISQELRLRETYEEIEDWQVVAVRDVADDERRWGEHGSLVAEWLDNGRRSHRWSRESDYELDRPGDEIFGRFNRHWMPVWT